MSSRERAQGARSSSRNRTTDRGRNDRHIWAERYDRELEDIFAIQDEITGPSSRRSPAASRRRRTIARSASDRQYGAYECVLAAKVLHHRRSARTMRGAAPLDALSRLTRTMLTPRLEACVLGRHGVRMVRGSRRHVAAGFRGGQTALALDDNDSDVHRILAALYLMREDHDKATTIRSGRSRSTPTTISSSCSKASF